MSNGAIVLGRERDLLPLFQGRTEELQRRMADEGIDLVLLTNVDSIYYYTAYWGDLGLEFGRPTMVAVAAGGEVTLITAESESLMARAMTWVDDLETFSDGVGNEWRDSEIPSCVLLSLYFNKLIFIHLTILSFDNSAPNTAQWLARRRSTPSLSD